jgi:hypothetical protein
VWLKDAFAGDLLLSGPFSSDDTSLADKMGTQFPELEGAMSISKLADTHRKHTFGKALEIKELCSVVHSKCQQRIEETTTDLIGSPLNEKDRLSLAAKMPQTESEAETFWRVVL